MIGLILAASATAVATGLGAIPVMFLGERTKALTPVLLGITAGVMVVASVMGLILPALDRGSPSEVGLGLVVGIVFLLLARRGMSHMPKSFGGSRGGRTAILVFLVLLVHSLPEGFAIGTAYEADPGQLGVFVVIAIGIQNIPEGTSIAIPMAATGASNSRMFFAAVLSSVPQPVGAVIAYLLVDEITALLPVSFGFAAGAMLALTVIEILPQGLRAGRRGTVVGATISAVAMVALSLALGV